MEEPSPERLSAIAAIRNAVANSENDPLVSIFVAPVGTTGSTNSTLPTPQIVTSVATPAQSMHSLPSFAGAVSRNRKTSMSLSSNPMHAGASNRTGSSQPASSLSPRCQSLSNTISTLSKEFQVEDDEEPVPIVRQPNSISPNSINHSKSHLVSPLHPRQHLLRLPVDGSSALLSPSSLNSNTSPKTNIESAPQSTTVEVGELVLPVPSSIRTPHEVNALSAASANHIVLAFEFSATSVNIAERPEEVIHERTPSNATTAAPGSPQFLQEVTNFNEKDDTVQHVEQGSSGIGLAPVIEDIEVDKESSSSSSIATPAGAYLGGNPNILGKVIHRRDDYGVEGSDVATVDVNSTAVTTLNSSQRASNGSKGPVTSHNRSQTLPGNSGTIEDEQFKTSLALSAHHSTHQRHSFTPLARSTVTAAPSISATFGKSSSPTHSKSKSDADVENADASTLCFPPKHLSTTSSNATGCPTITCEEEICDDATASLTFGGAHENIINLHSLPAMLSKIYTVPAAPANNKGHTVASMESSNSKTKTNIVGSGSMSLQPYHSRTNAFSTATLAQRQTDSDSATTSNTSSKEHPNNKNNSSEHDHFEGIALEVPLLTSDNFHQSPPTYRNGDEKDLTLSLPATTGTHGATISRGFDTATATMTLGNVDEDEDEIFDMEGRMPRANPLPTAIITVEGSSGSEGITKKPMMEGVVGGLVPRMGINGTTAKVIRIASHSGDEGFSNTASGNIVVMKTANPHLSSWASNPSSQVSENLRSPSAPKRGSGAQLLYPSSSGQIGSQRDSIDATRVMSMVEEIDANFAPLTLDNPSGTVTASEPFSGATRLDVRTHQSGGNTSPPLAKALTLTAQTLSVSPPLQPQRASSLVVHSAGGSPTSPFKGIARKPTNPLALPETLGLGVNRAGEASSIVTNINDQDLGRKDSVSALSPLLLGEAQQLRTNIEKHNNDHRNPIFGNTLTADAFDACKPLELSPQRSQRENSYPGHLELSPSSVSGTPAKIIRRKKGEIPPLQGAQR